MPRSRFRPKIPGSRLESSWDWPAGVRDFAEHGRIITHSYVREVASDVAPVGAQKEEVWTLKM